MDTDTGITWTLFFQILSVLIALYWILKFIGSVLKKLSKRTSTKRLVQRTFAKTLIVYKPLAAVFLALIFIGINYLVNGVLFLLLGVLLFGYLRSYLNGITFRINPIVYKGAHIVIENYEGEILRLLFFGLLIQEKNGKRFINYSDIEKYGFSIMSEDYDALKTALYLPEDVSDETILDLIFENPLVDYKETPTLEKVPGQATKKLLFTLEQGAKVEDVIAYLANNKINPTQ